MEESSSLYVNTLPGLLAIGAEVDMFLIYYVILRDQLKRLCDFTGWSFW